MKIIDYKVKGNLVRFFLGKDDCNDYWGDDWDDRPASCNAGSVYEEYVCGYADIMFPFEWTVIDAESDWHYSGDEPYCKEDYKNGVAPCLVAVPPEQSDNFYDLCYSEQVGNRNNTLIYFNDNVEDIKGCKIIQIEEVMYDEEGRQLIKKDCSTFNIGY